jgi:Ran GTPase-activating protein (RanGAP) involved in mRNA processing and transport
MVGASRGIPSFAHKTECSLIVLAPRIERCQRGSVDWTMSMAGERITKGTVHDVVLVGNTYKIVKHGGKISYEFRDGTYEGNVRFQSFLGPFRAELRAGRSPENQRSISQRVLNHWKCLDPPGRFLTERGFPRYCPLDGWDDDGAVWFVVASDKESLQRISFELNKDIEERKSAESSDKNVHVPVSQSWKRVQRTLDGLSATTKLTLSECELCDFGAGSVAKEVKRHARLTHLNMGHNHIGDAGAAAVAEAVKHSPALTALILGWNKIGDAGAAAMANALRHNSSLLMLSLQYNVIGHVGASAFSYALNQNSTLTEFNLRGNDLGHVGAASMADVMRQNCTLTALNMQYSNIGDAGTAHVADAMKHNTALTSLNLAGNRIGDVGAAAVAESIKYNSTLKALNINENKIGLAGTGALAEAMQQNCSLLILGHWGSVIGDDEGRTIAEALEQNSMLNCLRENLQETLDETLTCSRIQKINQCIRHSNKAWAVRRATAALYAGLVFRVLKARLAI